MQAIPESYPDTLAFIYERLPMFSRIGDAAMKKDLTNIRLLCDALGNPQNKFKSIHIGGTNGKGSVSHMLAAVLQQAGYETGLYTSPHLKDFRERIKINGAMIPEDEVTAFVKEHFQLIENIKPSFFEITVAMAFAWFATQAVDVAVVEVGLGGRLDSTNILSPEVSVITNISWDHQHILGHTLPEIAAEKAGIIKERVPVVVGETREETQPVFIKKALACHAPLQFADQIWQVVSTAYETDGLTVNLEHRGKDSGERGLCTYRLDLSGSYQEKNVCTTLAAITVLQEQHWQLTDEDIRSGLASVKQLTGLRGRWDVLGRHPLIVADVAHNEAGIHEVMRRVGMLSYNQLHIVTGFVKDKAVTAVLGLFPREAKYYFCQAAIPRALPATYLKAMAASAGLEGKAYPDIQQAFNDAQAHAGSSDLILVCGSVFIVAEVLP